MSATEILPGIWLGDITAAMYFQGPKLCLRSEPSHYMFTNLNDLHIPFDYGKVNKALLERAADWITARQNDGEPFLIHCASGMHRSPFILVYWMHTRGGWSIDDAYNLIISLRSIVERRDHWFKKPMAEREAAGLA